MSLETADQLSLPRDPATAMEAATKQYVDARGFLGALPISRGGTSSTNAGIARANLGCGTAATQSITDFAPASTTATANNAASAAATAQTAANNAASAAAAAQGTANSALTKATNSVQPNSNPAFGHITVTGAQSTGYVFQETGNAAHVWQSLALSGSGGIWNNNVGWCVYFNYASGAANFHSSITCTSVAQTSATRLKTHIRRDKQRYRGIRRAIEMVLYDRTSGLSHNEPGVLAEEVQQAGCHADDFVGKTDDGTLTIYYDKLALACALDPEP